MSLYSPKNDRIITSKTIHSIVRLIGWLTYSALLFRVQGSKRQVWTAYGGRSSAGRALVCGTSGRGFDPRRPPQQLCALCLASTQRVLLTSNR